MLFTEPTFAMKAMAKVDESGQPHPIMVPETSLAPEEAPGVGPRTMAIYLEAMKQYITSLSPEDGQKFMNSLNAGTNEPGTWDPLLEAMEHLFPNLSPDDRRKVVITLFAEHNERYGSTQDIEDESDNAHFSGSFYRHVRMGFRKALAKLDCRNRDRFKGNEA